MDVANASMYDGASAAAEACLMAARFTGRTEILVPESVHPHTRRVIETYMAHSGALPKTLPCPQGTLDSQVLKDHLHDNVAGVLVQNPNFFGCLENVHEISALAHESGALLMASTYPVSLGMITPPGEYNADIAVAEGQPMGLPLSYGGPYVGLMACKTNLLRKMPGRIVGETVDREGRRAYVLTLQAREQHIRREKSTSNICTNQALCALAATIHMSLLGKEGLRHLSQLNFQKAHYAASELKKRGFALTFSAPFFNEFTVKCPGQAKNYVQALSQEQILPGLPLGDHYPGREKDLLICVTEIKTKQDIDQFISRLERVAS